MVRPWNQKKPAPEIKQVLKNSQNQILIVLAVDKSTEHEL